jgi:hypothetical protein
MLHGHFAKIFTTEQALSKKKKKKWSTLYGYGFANVMSPPVLRHDKVACEVC